MKRMERNKSRRGRGKRNKARNKSITNWEENGNHMEKQVHVCPSWSFSCGNKADAGTGEIIPESELLVLSGNIPIGMTIQPLQEHVQGSWGQYCQRQDPFSTGGGSQSLGSPALILEDFSFLTLLLIRPWGLSSMAFGKWPWRGSASRFCPSSCCWQQEETLLWQGTWDRALGTDCSELGMSLGKGEQHLSSKGNNT